MDGRERGQLARGDATRAGRPRSQARVAPGCEQVRGRVEQGDCSPA